MLGTGVVRRLGGIESRDCVGATGTVNGRAYPLAVDDNIPCQRQLIMSDAGLLFYPELSPTSKQGIMWSRTRTRSGWARMGSFKQSGRDKVGNLGSLLSGGVGPVHHLPPLPRRKADK